MTTSTLGAPSSRSATDRPPWREKVVLLYALSAGVGWWFVHLVGLSALTPAVCQGLNRWVLTAVNIVSLLGVISALSASVALARMSGPGGVVRARNRFLGVVALMFNLASLALVLLESVPVYVLDPCR